MSVWPLASFLIFGAQWSHLALFCRNPVFLLSAGTNPDSLAFWVMTSLTFTFLGGGGVLWVLFCLCFASSTVFLPAGSAILNVLVGYRTFRIFDRNFQELLQRPLPDVTSSPGRSLSFSKNERGRSHLGCHYPVIQLYCCNMVRQESKKKSLPKNMLLPKNMSFCQPSRVPWIPHPQSPSTGILLAPLDTSHCIQNVFKLLISH